jgi:HK97 gp10 family phage protein
VSSFNFKIEGGKELDKALKQLGYDMEKKVAKSAVRAGAQVIRKEAMLNVPVESGTLKKSIRVVTRSRRVGDAVASVVTRSGKKYQSNGMDAWYAPLVEFGTKNRPATPFLRPALDSKGVEAVKKMSEVIQKRIAKLAG